MFDTLSEKFDQTIRKLRGLGKITERNVDDAVRDVRLALLEADVLADAADVAASLSLDALRGSPGAFGNRSIMGSRIFCHNSLMRFT